MTNTHRQKFAVVAAALSSDAREAAVQSQRLGVDGLLFDAFSPSLDLTTLSGTASVGLLVAYAVAFALGTGWLVRRRDIT